VGSRAHLDAVGNRTQIPEPSVPHLSYYTDLAIPDPHLYYWYLKLQDESNFSSVIKILSLVSSSAMLESDFTKQSPLLLQLGCVSMLSRLSLLGQISQKGNSCYGVNAARS
jgi:hypothetical protein